MDREGAVQSEDAALGYQGECQPAIEEYQPLGRRVQLQEEEETLCSTALEGYSVVGDMEEERVGSSENLNVETEDTAVQYRLLDDCKEEEGQKRGGRMEREAYNYGDSSQFQITPSASEASSEGEGEEEQEAEKTEGGYMLLCQDEQTLEEEEEEAEEGDNLGLQGYQPAGVRPSRMANWLQKQMEELNRGQGSGERGRGCESGKRGRVYERGGGGCKETGGGRKGGPCKGSERGGCEGGGGGCGSGEEKDSVGEGDTGWATFDDSATAFDSHNWPGSTHHCSPAHPPVERGLVAPVSNMEEGMERKISGSCPGTH